MMYVRLPLSLGNFEDLLQEQRIDVCHETERFWRFHDNTIRSYSALGYRPPAPECIVPMGQTPTMH